MKSLVGIILLSFMSLSIAGIEQAPPPFQVKNGRAIFVDYTNAVYDLTYDKSKKRAWANVTIHFIAENSGFPIFDSLNEPTEVMLDGVPATHGYTPVPGEVSFVRYIAKEVVPGFHTMTIRLPITEMVKYKRKGVSSAFLIKDLSDRMFLERYVVANYEYDQVQMTFNVNIIGTNRIHNVFANGKVTELAKNRIKIVYPKYFTASSLFFHLVPITKFWRLRFKYRSISGAKIPVTIYSISRWVNRRYSKKTVRVLRELENDYGPWPHPQVLVYANSLKGGMEYAGATATSYGALDHELQHSYFAKGIHPANGNSGWMDEGIASWRDKGHFTHSKPDYFSWNLANHNIYTRKTDSNSYVKGRSFFAYIDHKIKELGKPGFQHFLRGYFEKRKFTTVTTNDLKSDLEEYTGLDLTEDFNQYIFGGGLKNSRSPAVEPLENPYHPSYTDEELESII